jgi:hypothetical protein
VTDTGTIFIARSPIMLQPLNRRDMLKSTGAALTAAALSPITRCAWANPAVGAEILERKVISQRDDLYHGWPTVARRRNGQLLLVCSGGRALHVCPFGRVELMRSDDDGQTWGWPCVLLDTEIDDRDAGVLETAKGTILVTTFTSLAYVDSLEKAARIKQGEPGAWDAKRLQMRNVCNAGKRPTIA